jgi:hypothetical protein
LRVLAVIIAGAIPLQACTTTNAGCFGTDLAGADSGSLEVVLGLPSSRFADSTFIVLYSPSQATPQATLELELTPAPMPWPNSLDETPCGGMDWRTFRIVVDPDDWTRFWALPRPMPFEARIGSLNSMAPLRANRFGVALVDTTTAEIRMACGCFRT